MIKSPDTPVPSDQHNPDLPMNGDDKLTLARKAANQAQRKSSDLSTEMRYTSALMTCPLPYMGA